MSFLHRLIFHSLLEDFLSFKWTVSLGLHCKNSPDYMYSHHENRINPGVYVGRIMRSTMYEKASFC